MADERGEHFHRLRNIWYGMLHRCTNPEHDSYANYGGRGITVSDDWHSFSKFYEDMIASYRPGLSIGRQDNDGPYSFGNCQWETKAEQANNRRSSKLITINETTQTLAQWTKQYGAKPSTVRQRFYVYGWDIESSLTGMRSN